MKIAFLEKHLHFSLLCLQSFLITSRILLCPKCSLKEKRLQRKSLNKSGPKTAPINIHTKCMTVVAKFVICYFLKIYCHVLLLLTAHESKSHVVLVKKWYVVSSQTILIDLLLKLQKQSYCKKFFVSISIPKLNFCVIKWEKLL